MFWLKPDSSLRTFPNPCSPLKFKFYLTPLQPLRLYVGSMSSFLFIATFRPSFLLCTHTSTHTWLPWCLCTICYHLIRPGEGLGFPLSPSSSPYTTLDSFRIHIDNTARTLPPSFLIFSTYFVLPTSAHHHFILCITIGHTLPQSVFWVNQYQIALPASWEIYVQVKKPQLKLDMGKKKNWTWNNGLVPNQERRTSRLYIVTLLI